MITSAKKTFFLFSLALMPLLALDAAQPTLHRSPCITPDAQQPRRRSQRIMQQAQQNGAADLLAHEPEPRKRGSIVHPGVDTKHDDHLKAMATLVTVRSLQDVIDCKNDELFLINLSSLVDETQTKSDEYAHTTRAGAATTFDADKAVYALLQRRLNCVNAVLNDDTGITSLMRAAASLQPAIVQALVDAGADPLIKDGKGLTAFDYARQHTEVFPKGRKNIVAILNKVVNANGNRSFFKKEDADTMDEESPKEGPDAPTTRTTTPKSAQQAKPSLLKRLCRCCCPCSRR